MPLVRISVLDRKDEGYRKTVADRVNEAVLETLDFPPDDRYQLIQGFSSQNFELQNREGDRIVLELTMRAGQAREDKQAFYARVAELLEQDPGIPPENVMIVITENGEEDWSFQDGVAQFIADS
ncbi:tautomerase family protein [Natrialba taiwanensis]|uniref:4-oxalocrotonate tautomerase n=1 Tax=Natrialba taiwanensis DSM 12281 TaxID=1230458 RepID=L9ZJA7_9EURY|nr:tautomerase family protein [Natrialba taiwanensis]ELY86444.1 4-oxalocrotonate tautomerase [Natrialba taiwanensis DSM 12281]